MTIAEIALPKQLAIAQLLISLNARSPFHESEK